MRPGDTARRSFEQVVQTFLTEAMVAAAAPTDPNTVLSRPSAVHHDALQHAVRNSRSPHTCLIRCRNERGSALSAARRRLSGRALSRQSSCSTQGSTP
jgi:hypothetical protein